MTSDSAPTPPVLRNLMAPLVLQEKNKKNDMNLFVPNFYLLKIASKCGVPHLSLTITSRRSDNFNVTPFASVGWLG